VPVAGVEPARVLAQRILSYLRDFAAGVIQRRWEALDSFHKLAPLCDISAPTITNRSTIRNGKIT